MIIKLIPGKPYNHLPSPRSIAEDISEDVNAMVERYEKDNGRVEVTLNYMHGNILAIGITAFGLTPGSTVFTSLNLWQADEKNYVYNMQDGKVSGFKMQSLKDYTTLTTVQFVEHILHDLFYGW